MPTVGASLRTRKPVGFTAFSVMVSSRALQLKGQRFGRLIAIEIAGKQRKMNTWRCICDCGNETITTATRLKSGKTRSCGCLAGEKHGMAGTRTYRIWTLMKDRCNNPRSNIYKNFSQRQAHVDLSRQDPGCNRLGAGDRYQKRNNLRQNQKRLDC